MTSQFIQFWFYLCWRKHFFWLYEKCSPVKFYLSVWLQTYGSLNTSEKLPFSCRDQWHNQLQQWLKEGCCKPCLEFGVCVDPSDFWCTTEPSYKGVHTVAVVASTQKRTQAKVLPLLYYIAFLHAHQNCSCGCLKPEKNTGESSNTVVLHSLPTCTSEL